MKNSIPVHFSCYILIGLLFASCSTPKEGIESGLKTPNEKTERGTYIISAPIVYKNSMSKRNEVMEFKDVYIRRSIQDYYIKFCESMISRNELERHLNKISGDIKALTLEVQFREGEWDICEGDPIMQSRIGQYVIIYRVVE
jgi:hypothetical protein